jgi:hypothetical protein
MSTKTKRLLNIGIGCALIPVAISTYIVGAGGMAIYMVSVYPVMLGVDYVQNNTTENASEITHNVLCSFMNCIDSLSSSCFYQNKEKNFQ